MANRLFAANLPELKWLQFEAEGFSQPVPGVVYRADHPPCYGVPLGGISTGCIDVDPRGVFGFSTLFNPSSRHAEYDQDRMARKLPTVEPIIGLAVGEKTWVLAKQEMISGGELPWCTEPQGSVNFIATRGGLAKTQVVSCPNVEGVQTPKEIYYWGHYPVVDMEFEMDAPISVGLRAWSPFIPGDAAASNITAAMFEVHLRNTSGKVQEGTIVFNFGGPDTQEARGTEFTRQLVKEDFEGVLVTSTGGVSYTLGVIGEEQVRFGTGFKNAPAA